MKKQFIILALLFIALSFPGKVKAATATLTPTGQGNFTAWTLGAGASKPVAVTTNDGNTGYITTATSGNRDTYGFTNAAVPTNSIINSVTINIVAEKTVTQTATIVEVVEKGTIAADISAGATNCTLTTQNVYQTCTFTRNTNPFTSAAWTYSEVNSWINGSDSKAIKFGVQATANRSIYVTQVSVVVDYTPVPSKVAFTNAQRTLTAGACNGVASVLTVQLQDSNSVATNPTGDTVIRITSNSPSYTIYSDSNCQNTVTNGDFTYLANTDNTKSVYIVDTRKSNPTWTLTAHKQSGPQTISDGTQAITTNAGTVSRLVITLPSQSFTDGVGNSGSVDARTAGGSFTITRISATDNYFNVNTGYSGGKTLAYSGPGNAPNSQGPSYTTSVSFTAGQSTTTLTTTLYRAESTTITVTDGGLYGYASSSLTVNGGAIYDFVVSISTPQAAGVCFTGTNTVQARDQWQNNITNDNTTVISMSTSGTNVTFYTDSSCANGNETTQYTLSSGAKTLYIKTTKKQSFTVTVTKYLSTETGTSGSILVNAGAVTRLVITLPGQSFTDGVGNNANPVTAQTAGSPFNLVSISATDNYFNVNTGYSGGKTLTYSGPGNAPNGKSPDYTTSVSFTSGRSTTVLATTLYKVENASITITEGALYGYPSASITVNAGGLNNFEVSVSTPQTAGVCFTGTSTVKARDAWNNYRTLDTSIVLMSSSGANVTFYTDSGCTGGNETSQYTLSGGSTNIYLKNTRKQSFTVTATKNLSFEAGTSNSITVNAGAVTRLVITLPGQSFTDGVGNSGTVTDQTAGNSFNLVSISATDNYFNINPNYSGTKSLTYSGPNNALNGQSPLYTEFVDFTTGQSTTTLTTILYKAESTTITVKEGALYGYASSSLTVNGGSLNNFEVSVASPQTAGVCFTGTNVIRARDAWNNYKANDTSVVDITDSGVNLIYYTDSSCTGGNETTQYTLSSGQTNIYAKVARRQNFTITATKHASTETGTSNTITVNSGAVTRLVVTLPGQSFTDGAGNSGSVTAASAGSQFNIVSVSATDDYFNINTGYSGGKTLTFSGPNNAPNGKSPDYTTSVSFTNGQSTTTLATTLYKAESTTISVKEGTSYGYPSSSLTVNVGGINNYLVSASTPQSSGVSFNVTITARDAWNNNLGSNYSAPAGTYIWSTTAGSAPNGQGASIGSLTQSDFVNGVATKNVTLYKAESNITFTASEPSPSTVTGISSGITVNATGLNNYVVAPDGGSKTAGVSFNVTITARDAWNNNLGSNYSAPAGTYIWSTTAGSAPNGQGASIGSLTQSDFVNGVATKNVTLYKAESNITFTAAEPSPSSVTGTSASISINGGSLNNFEVSVASPQTAGVCFTGTNTAKARDLWNNYITQDNSTVVNLTTSGANVTFYTDPSCTGGNETTQYTLSSGEANLYIKTTKKQFLTITATKYLSTETGESEVVTVSPGTVSRLVVTLPNQSFTDGIGNAGSVISQTAGVQFNLASITATDDYFNINSNYTGDKTLSYSGPGDGPNGKSPDYTTSVHFNSGQSTTTLSTTLYKVESSPITVTEGELYGYPSSSLTVSPGSSTVYKVTTSGNPQVAGANFTVTITAQDSWQNNKGSGYTAPPGTYTWTTTASNAPDSTSPTIGTLTQSDFVNGVATKTITLYKAEGSVTFTASEPTPSVVTGTSAAVTVNPGSVSLSKSTVSGPTSAPQNGNVSVSVTLIDNWENPISGVNGADISFAGTTATYTIVSAPNTTSSYGVSNAQLSWSDSGTKTVYVTVSGAGQLINPYSVVVLSVQTPTHQIRGGSILRGGTKL